MESTAETPVVSEVGFEVREKEEDILRRQIFIIQDAVKTDMQMFIGSVDMFEAMIDEDVRKQKRKWNNASEDKKENFINYEPADIIERARSNAGLKPTEKMNVGIQYTIALEKFKRLYKIFKDEHIPFSKETRL